MNGRRYVDFAGGIAVLNVGHRHPRVMAAVAAQADRYTHTAFQVMPYEPYIELCERLNALAPVEGTAKSILFTTGAEASENAAKIARAATGRDAIITFVGGFHGRSLFASALTGKVEPYKSAFGGMAAGVFHAPFPSPETGITVEESLRALDFIFRADVSPKAVAAIMLEPVQGEGGFHIASPAFLGALRRICDEHGILLIADEVQTGFARTGRMFAIEHSGIKPDLVAMAKSLGGGFPIAAVSGRADIMDAVPPGGLGGTYAGSPVACAAALAVLDVIEDEGLLARAEVIGRCVVESVMATAGSMGHGAIQHVRTLGAMNHSGRRSGRGPWHPALGPARFVRCQVIVAETRPEVFALLRQRAFIGGEWIDCSRKIEVTDPATGSVLGSVPDLGADATRDAVESAERTLRTWRKVAPLERANILMK